MMSKYTKEYNLFFTSPAGKYFLDFLNEQIQSEHELAEADPMLARDHAGRARGIRVPIDHINSVTAGSKPSE